MHREDYFGYLAIIFTCIVTLIILIFSFKSTFDTDKAKKSCEEACVIYKSKIIDEVCHCLNETGWRKAP